MNAERNYLMGLLAVRLKIASTDEIAEISQKAPNVDLGDSLLAAGKLTQEEHDSLAEQVDEAITAHGGNTGAAATSLGVPPEEAQTLSESLLSDNSTAQTVVTDADNSNAATVVTDDVNSHADTMVASDPDGTSATVVGVGPPPGVGGDGVVPAVQEHAGRYDTMRTFAAGGMGKILLVHDKHLGRDIALKTLLPERLPGGGTFFTKTGAPTMEMLTVPIIARFLQEAHVTGQLEHPSIVPVYELGYRNDGSLYYTMKFVRGTTMQDAIKNSKDIHDRLQLLTHFLDLCQAIAYAHSRGVIHRDLKPLNVMIGEFGETVLIDWGIAKVKGQQDIHARGLAETVRTMRLSDAEATAKTMYGQTIGSPYYMPPEQSAGQLDKVGEPADIYSLGAVLYHILAGDPPYKGNNVRQFMEKVKDFDPKPIEELEPMAPPELIAVVKRAMARKPEDRYASAKDLADEVQRFVSGGLVNAYDYNLGELARRFVKKHWKVLSTAAAGLIALLAFGVYYNIRVTEQRNIAVAAQEAEEIAKNEAIAAQEAEEIQRKQAQQELYFASVALSQRSMEAQLMEQARTQLATAPAAYRGWEWGHLLHEAHADLLTLPTGGRYVRFQGDTLIAGKANGTVEAWNLETAVKGNTFVEKAGFGYALDHDAAHNLLAVSGDSAVTVWDASNGSVLFRHEEANTENTYHLVSLDRAGQRVAALNSDRNIRVWNLSTGEAVFELRLEQIRGAHLEMSPDGSTLLVGQARFGAEGFVHGFGVYRVADGTLMGEHSLPAPDSAKTSAFSPDGALVAVGLDNSLQVWDVEPWAQRYSLPGRYALPGTVTFSPDGAAIAAGSRDGALGVWRASDGEGLVRDNAHLDQIRGVRFSPDGSRVASVAADRTVRLWSAEGVTPLKTFRGHNATLFNLAISDSGTRLATTSFDGEAKVWDLEATADWAPASPVAYQREAGLMAGALPDGVQVWDGATGHPTHFMPVEARPTLLAFSNTATHLAGVAGTTLTVWNADTGETLRTVEVPQGSRGLALGARGEVAVVESNTALSAYSVTDGEELWGLEGVASWAISEAGVAAAVKREDGGYTLYQGDTSQSPVDTGVVIPSDFGAYVDWSDDDRWILCAGVRGGDANDPVFLKVVAAEGGSEVAELTGHDQAIIATTLSPEANLLATGSKDSTVTLWDTATWQSAGTLTGHASNINDLIFTPDGKRLVTASEDGTFKIWDVANRREIMTLQDAALSAEGQVVAPQEVRFSNDGHTLFTRTRPAVQPLLLRAFPWDEGTVPSGDAKALSETVHAWKQTNEPVPPSP